MFKYLNREKPYMLQELKRFVAEKQSWMRADPELFKEPGFPDSEPMIDVRLCVDVRPGDGIAWCFRTGDASYDPQHSELCGAACISLKTQAAALLEELFEQVSGQAASRLDTLVEREVQP